MVDSKVSYAVDPSVSYTEIREDDFAMSKREAPFLATYYWQNRLERLMPKCMNARSIQAFQDDFEVRDDDVWVVTFAKAGTTFILEIVDGIMHMGDIEAVKNKPMQDKINLIELGPAPGLPHATYKKLAKWPSPRQIQTHLYPDMLPKQLFKKKPKIIFLSRNPKDCAVSLFQWHQTVKFLEPTEWDYFLPKFMEGQVVYGSWFEHTAAWFKYRDEPNFLHLKYEDLKRDRGKATKQIIKHLGMNLTEQQIQNVVDHTDFKNMKEYMKSVENRDAFLRQDRHWQRKGKSGDWRVNFTVAENEAFDAVYQKEMVEKYGIDYDFY
ncbi:sulfotransferase 1B1-like [Glandiceps talaboti]